MGSGNQILRDIRKHRKKGGILAHEAKHCEIKAPFWWAQWSRSKLVNISSIRTRVKRR
jgi:hypothetical protein